MDRQVEVCTGLMSIANRTEQEIVFKVALLCIILPAFDVCLTIQINCFHNHFSNKQRFYAKSA